MTLKKLLFVLGIFYIGVDSHLLTPLNSFQKELTFHDKQIILTSSYYIVTANDSFLYAVCDSHEKTFKENKCNVTIETPAFENATYKEVCPVHLVSSNRNFEMLTKFSFYHFGEDKVLLSWLVTDSDFRTKVAKVRILHWSNCDFYDVFVPADTIYSIVTFDNSFDVVMNNKTMCRSEYCKITYDANGKKVSGPTPLVPNIKIASLEGVIPINSKSSAKGLYLLGKSNKNFDTADLIRTDHNGNGVEFAKIKNYDTAKMTNSHDYFTVCWIKKATNVTCSQYDERTNTNKEVIIRFFDNWGPEFTRWIHPHNLPDHGLLLLSGQTNIHNQPKFDRFTITKIQPNGHREKSLEIGGLNFQCTSIQNFFVDVTDHVENEICFHFICDKANFDKHGITNTLKFSTKCLPKTHVSMAKNRTLKTN